MLNLVLVILAIVSAILFTMTIISFVSSTKKRNHYRECMGTIVRIWKRESPGESANQQIISPIISYTVCGKKYEIVGIGYLANMKIGQEAAILYDEDDPSKAVMKKGLYFMSFITGIASFTFAAVFIIMAALKYAGLISF